MAGHDLAVDPAVLAADALVRHLDLAYLLISVGPKDQTADGSPRPKRFFQLVAATSVYSR